MSILINIIRKNIDIDKSNALFFTINNNLYNSQVSIGEIYKSNKNEELIVLNFNHNQTLKVPCNKDIVLNKGISIAIRPEKVSLVKDIDSALLSGEIVDVSFFGTDTHYSIQLDSISGDDAHNFHVRIQNASNQSKQYVAGERVGVVFNAEDIQVIGN